VTTAAAMQLAHSVPAQPIERAGFEAFYAATSRALQSYLRRVAGDPAIVDDILQETYVRLLSAPPLAEAQRKSYLYRTATNLVADHHRARSRRRRWWQLTPRRPEAASSGLELSSDMERLFALLDARDRALLWLAYVEESSHREIAEVLQLRETSVKVLLYRARRRMETILVQHGFEANHE
jgi:RNA polymerase sigma-70 factor (ECF subfamily)